MDPAFAGMTNGNFRSVYRRRRTATVITAEDVEDFTEKVKTFLSVLCGCFSSLCPLR